VSDLALELDYANRFGGMSAQLATGTEPFDGAQVPLGIGF
jgi:hypothetical protein